MSVVAPKGFRATGVAGGIKKDARDLALVVCDTDAVAAGVFTRNQAAAASVVLSRSHVSDGTARAIVANSGCANAATGPRGTADALAMAQAVAAAIGSAPDAVLVCSTGTIGPYLPMDRVTTGIRLAAEALGGGPSDGTAAAEAIMTTDSVTKEAVVAGDGWIVGGMAKGAGMIRPDMATMLAFITTDAVVDAPTLRSVLAEAVDGSFNSLNIDGCESTNDTVLALSSGASGVVPGREEFAAAMAHVCRSLAMAMARDAEGASRMVTIEVTGASDDGSARVLGRTIADSALVRSSFYGGDVNWGRILGAMGTATVPFDIDSVTIAYNGVTVFSGGVGAPFDEPALLEACSEGDLALVVTVGSGPGRADVVTTDLTPEYVTFNAERS